MQLIDLNVGDYLTTTGGFQPETLRQRPYEKDYWSNSIKTTGKSRCSTPAIDAQGRPIDQILLLQVQI